MQNFKTMFLIPQVFVDIPGLNCKDRGAEYRQYVEDHFPEFDYFIILLDGAKLQSLATSEASSEHGNDERFRDASPGE